MGEPGPIVVALMGDEYLGLVFEPAERHGMADAVAVALELGATARLRLGPAPSAAGLRHAGVDGMGRHGAAGPTGALAEGQSRPPGPRPMSKPRGLTFRRYCLHTGRVRLLIPSWRMGNCAHD